MAEPGCERLLESFRSVLSQVEPHTPDCLEAAPPQVARSEPRHVAFAAPTAERDIGPPQGPKIPLLWVWVCVGLTITSLIAIVIILVCRQQAKPRRRRKSFKPPAQQEEPDEDVYDDDESDDDQPVDPPTIHGRPPKTARSIAARRAQTTRSVEPLHPTAMRAEVDRVDEDEEDPLFQPLRQKGAD